jgi:alpha-tubulin suppressor-like RCC1 family protein
VSGLEDVVSIAAGPTHSVAVTSSGDVYTYGSNESGQLGNGTTDDQDEPVLVTGFIQTYLENLVYIAAGADHSLAVKDDGTVVAWGDNETGALGVSGLLYSDVPVAVPGLTGVTKVAAGKGFSLALKSDGTVLSWGTNSFGQLGRGAVTDGTTPGATTLSNITDIAAGAHHALALRSNGTVMSWGRQYDGQLGLSSSNDRNTPQQIPSNQLSGVTKIAAGALHSMALKSNGSLYVWGSSATGQLGLGETAYVIRPTVVPNLSDVTDIAAGGYHSLAVKDDGSVFSWGTNTYGELGSGLTELSTTPQIVTLNGSALTDAVSVGAGEYHSLVVLEDGTLRTFGKNTTGQLGDDSNVYSEVPIHPVLLRQSVIQAVGGGYHTMVLTQDGNLFSFGGNFDGQLGHTGTKDAWRPTRVFDAAP